MADGGQRIPAYRRKRVLALLLVSLLIVGGAVAFLASRPPQTPDGLAPVIHERVKQPEYHPDLVNVSVEDESVTYVHRTDSPTLNYSVGDIIVGTTGNGYLRWVRGIQRDGNRTIVRTDQASLADAIVHGGFSLNQSVLPGTRFGFTVELNHPLLEAEGIKVDLTGEAKFDVGVDLETEFSWGSLTYLRFAVSTALELSIGVEVAGSLGNRPQPQPTTFFTADAEPIPVEVGPLPVVLVPRLSLTGGVQIQSGLAISMQLNATTTAGVEYNGGDWSSIFDRSFEVDPHPPSFGGAVDATVFALVPRLEVLVYGVVGPFAELKPYLRAHASLAEDPWWKLFAGADLNVGFTLQVWDYDLGDVFYPLHLAEWELAHATEAHPSAPRNLTAEPADGRVRLTWQAPTGGSAVTNYTIFRGNTSGAGTPLKTVGPVLAYNDTGLTNGRTYYYTVRAFSGNLEGPPSEEASARPTAGPPAWTNPLADGAGGSPPARWGHAAIGDMATNRMVVFGGADRGSVTLYNDTWVLSNASGLGGPPTWTNLIADGTPGSPPARWRHTAVYDASTNRMIVFGGRNASGPRNDVWVLANANGLGGTPTWTNLIPDGAPGSPAARVDHTAAYDAANNRMIVFGGEAASVLLNDAWVLSNANGLGGVPTWTNIVAGGVPGSPLARRLHSAVYVAASNRLIVFGGGSATVHNDVWMLANANGLGGTPTWTNTFADGVAGLPFGRRGHTAVYDPGNDRMIVFAGEDSGAATHDDVWVLANASGPGGAWTNTVADGTLGSPWDRRLHSAVYDASKNRMVVFAGASGVVFNDVWVLSNASGMP
ncbi:MAG TPA: kelch repeat-containing protein [Thermoplasmata archaeon]|nr:kelch repeat-containing protein [Thermoplasmata archaeon]